MGDSGGYKFSQTTHIQFSDSSPKTLWKSRHLMADTIRRNTGDGCYGRNSLPQPEATLQPYSPEHEHGNPPPPPRCVPEASLPVHGSGYAPQWNEPTLHSSVQDQRYGVPVPYVNDVASSYSVWTDAQPSAPFAPAMNVVTPYKNQNQNQDTGITANGPTPYQQDNRIPPGRDLHGWPTTGVQHGGVVDYGPTFGGTSAHSAATKGIRAFASDGEAPAPSESLGALARRYVLDPGTRIESVHIGPNRYGRLKVIIMLDAADGV